MKFLTPQTIQEPLNKQFAIFGNKHNWVMTWLYVMTFGSFIGYANAFPPRYIKRRTVIRKLRVDFEIKCSCSV